MAKRQELFKKVFAEFLDDLDSIKPCDPALVIARMATGYLSPQLMMDQFVENTKNYKDKILEKNEKFFLEGDFEEAGDFKEEIDRLKSIWSDSSVSKEDKDIVWNYMILLVKLAYQEK